jgi:hypothetical protein
MGGAQEGEDAPAQRLHLLGRHQSIRHIEQYDDHPIVMGRTTLAIRLHVGAQVAEHPRQIPVPAE